MRPRARATGFTYLAVLLMVALLGVGLALTGEVWHTAARREKEAQLLFVGNQYRQAIRRYFLNGPGQYPRSLSALLRDARQPGTVRYLRRLYPDPIAGDEEWGLVRAADGGIMGVYSRSNAAPIKTAGFRERDRTFRGATTYYEWRFLYEPQPVAAPRPGAAPAPPAAGAR